MFTGGGTAAAHRAISGAMGTASPLLIPAAMANPVGTAGMMARGAAGSAVGSGVTGLMGASQGTQDLSGDVLGLLSGSFRPMNTAPGQAFMRTPVKDYSEPFTSRYDPNGTNGGGGLLGIALKSTMPPIVARGAKAAIEALPNPQLGARVSAARAAMRGPVERPTLTAPPADINPVETKVVPPEPTGRKPPTREEIEAKVNAPKAKPAEAVPSPAQAVPKAFKVATKELDGISKGFTGNKFWSESNTPNDQRTVISIHNKMVEDGKLPGPALKWDEKADGFVPKSAPAGPVPPPSSKPSVDTSAFEPHRQGHAQWVAEQAHPVTLSKDQRIAQYIVKNHPNLTHSDILDPSKVSDTELIDFQKKTDPRFRAQSSIYSREITGKNPADVARSFRGMIAKEVELMRNR